MTTTKLIQRLNDQLAKIEGVDSGHKWSFFSCDCHGNKTVICTRCLCQSTIRDGFCSTKCEDWNPAGDIRDCAPLIIEFGISIKELYHGSSMKLYECGSWRTGKYAYLCEDKSPSIAAARAIIAKYGGKQ